jgi:hypothetical protein
MEKMIKTALRLWLAFTSLLALLFGWVLLAHSEKPAPLVSQEPPVSSLTIPQLSPIPSLEQLQENPGSPIQNSSVPSVSFNFPILRTRGS